MNLNLSDAQLRKAMKGLTFQVTPGQMGSGMKFNLNPSNIKKLEKAYRLGKGARMALSGGELGNYEDEFEGGNVFKSVGRSIKKTANKIGKSAGKAIEKEGTKLAYKTGDRIKKVATKKVNEADKWAKKNITEKNVAKYALKGYNELNKEMERQGMDSIHSAVLNEGLGYVPFVPQSAKDVASAYAEKRIDRALAKESERLGAGFGRYKKSIKSIPRRAQYRTLGGSANPYLPTGLMGGSGVSSQRKMRGGATKVYDDHRNILRPNQAGFSGLSRQESERNTITGGSFRVRGGGFRI